MALDFTTWLDADEPDPRDQQEECSGCSADSPSKCTCSLFYNGEDNRLIEEEA